MEGTGVPLQGKLNEANVRQHGSGGGLHGSPLIRGRSVFSST